MFDLFDMFVHCHNFTWEGDTCYMSHCITSRSPFTVQKFWSKKNNNDRIERISTSFFVHNANLNKQEQKHIQQTWYNQFESFNDAFSVSYPLYWENLIQNICLQSTIINSPPQDCGVLHEKPGPTLHFTLFIILIPAYQMPSQSESINQPGAYSA